MNLLFLAAQSDAPRSFFYENWIIIKQFIWLFSQVMNGIMMVLDKIGVHNITLCIVLFTIITKTLLIPLTVKQQKFTRMNAYISPELKKIQEKYKGKRDQASQQKMMMEQQALQEKYGVSMSAGCLPMLVQFPILFALYPVIYNMEKYVSYLQNFSDTQLTEMFTFLGMNLKDAPGLRFTPAIILPILVGGSQYLATKVMTSHQDAAMAGDENPMNATMKSMNVVMPLMLAFFAINFPAFLAIYWIVQSLVMALQQVLINKHLDKTPIEDVIKANIEKENKKREKKGLPPISDKASMSTRNMNAYENSMKNKAEAKPGLSAEEKEEKIRKATEYYNNRSAAPGSLAAKANMVRDYNEKHVKK